MSTVNIAVSRTMQVPAREVYAILADYRNHHPHILSKIFTHLEVEEGGYGAGTVFKAHLKLMGQTRSFRMRVAEPEPGRVMVERDLAVDLETQFIVEPQSDNQSEVTIATIFQSSPGLKGWLERLTAPIVMRHAYREELQKLDAYAQRNV